MLGMTFFPIAPSSLLWSVEARMIDQTDKNRMVKTLQFWIFRLMSTELEIELGE
jgi:hypothetical protein